MKRAALGLAALVAATAVGAAVRAGEPAMRGVTSPQQARID